MLKGNIVYFLANIVGLRMVPPVHNLKWYALNLCIKKYVLCVLWGFWLYIVYPIFIILSSVNFQFKVRWFAPYFELKTQVNVDNRRKNVFAVIEKTIIFAIAKLFVDNNNGMWYNVDIKCKYYFEVQNGC